VSENRHCCRPEAAVRRVQEVGKASENEQLAASDRFV